ncbi:hypothetical protein [Brotaphodocola catenula]|uniref:hypothetical protein n=1 Tax=Brotaphodocola catenula TaxID=2885361 RepID=UPI0032C1E13F
MQERFAIAETKEQKNKRIKEQKKCARKNTIKNCRKNKILAVQVVQERRTKKWEQSLTTG